MAWNWGFRAGLSKVQHAAEQRQREAITFHHHVAAGRGRTNAVLSFADVFSSIELGRFAEFQSGHAGREGQRAQVGLAQLPASFEPRHGDLGGPLDEAPQQQRVALVDLHGLHPFHKARTFCSDHHDDEDEKLVQQVK